MTTAIALHAPRPAVAAAWNARGYTLLWLEDHAESRRGGCRMDFAARHGRRASRPASRGAQGASKRGPSP